MKLKLIQVGLGAHGMGVGRDYVLPSQDFEYAGLVDINESQLKACGELFNVPQNRLFTNYRKAFAELDADVVFISTISPMHYEICREALLSGLHVLIEKPFVTEMNGARVLVEEAKTRNLRLMVSQNYRYNNNVVTLKKAIQDEKIGKPLYVKGDFYYNHSGKLYQCKMDNFMLLEMAVHHIDMMRFMFDSDIEKVRGETWNFLDSMYKGDSNVSANYELENGISIFYFGSLVSKGLATQWEGIWRIQCERGSLHLDDLGQGYGVYIVDERGQVEKLECILLTEKESINGILVEFAAAIKEEREPKISGRDNLHTLAALFATSDSSKDGKWKSIKDYLKS